MRRVDDARRCDVELDYRVRGNDGWCGAGAEPCSLCRTGRATPSTSSSRTRGSVRPLDAARRCDVDVDYRVRGNDGGVGWGLSLACSVAQVAPPPRRHPRECGDSFGLLMLRNDAMLSWITALAAMTGCGAAAEPCSLSRAGRATPSTSSSRMRGSIGPLDNALQ